MSGGVIEKEQVMKRHLVLALLSLSFFTGSSALGAQDAGSGASAPICAEKLSKQQFVALPPSRRTNDQGRVPSPQGAGVWGYRQGGERSQGRGAGPVRS